jgi:hypothetical protein
LTADDVVAALAYLHPAAEWSYDGDGSTLDPVTVDGKSVSRGLEWHSDGDPPTLSDLEAALPAVQAAASLATAADHQAASAAIITEKLAAVPVPRDDLATILQGLLDQTADAIPFFEQYALDPSMSAQQWTDFQQLDQTTKDRLLYDVVRSMAAIMRYLSGDLPVPA